MTIMSSSRKVEALSERSISRRRRTAQSSIVFAFGPDDTFFFETPKGRKCNNLPKKVADAIAATDEKGLERTFCVSFAPEGNLLLGYREKCGRAHLTHYAAPEKLLTWARDPTLRRAATSSTGRSSTEYLRFTLGPANSFFACRSATHNYRWDNLPPGLEDALQRRIGPDDEGNSDGGWRPGQRPMQVALGKDGAWVLVLSGGITVSDCEKDYGDVHNLLSEARENGKRVEVRYEPTLFWFSFPRDAPMQLMLTTIIEHLKYVALNACVPNQYYVLFRDGSSDWKVPAAYAKDVESLAADLAVMSPRSRSAMSPDSRRPSERTERSVGDFETVESGSAGTEKG